MKAILGDGQDVGRAAVTKRREQKKNVGHLRNFTNFVTNLQMQP